MSYKVVISCICQDAFNLQSLQGIFQSQNQSTLPFTTRNSVVGSHNLIVCPSILLAQNPKWINAECFISADKVLHLSVAWLTYTLKETFFLLWESNRTTKSVSVWILSHICVYRGKILQYSFISYNQNVKGRHVFPHVRLRVLHWLLLTLWG